MTAVAETEYRLLSYRNSDGPAAGVLIGDLVFPAAALLEGSNVDASSVMAMLAHWPEAHRTIAEVAASPPSSVAGVPLGDVDLLAPVLYPNAIFCAGANYWDHLEEMDGPMDRGSRAREPWFFLKTAAHSVVADHQAVQVPAGARQLDWEAELAVVIGRPARNVTTQDAHDYIAGFTIINDLSLRDRMRRDDRPAAMTYDWVGQKCFPGAAPMGPWITPATYIEDCHKLDIRLWVNDELKQSSNTSQLIHDVHEQLSWLSGQLHLLPGDVIATGTPAGVGLARGEFLKPGDVTTIEVDGCGTLTTTFVAAELERIDG